MIVGRIKPLIVLIVSVYSFFSVNLYADAKSLKQGEAVIESILPYPRVSVSQTDTAIEMYNRVLYLNGMGKSDWDWILGSFVYAGIYAAFFTIISRKLILWCNYRGRSGSTIFTVGAMLSSLIYLDSKVTRWWFGIKLISQLFSLAYPGPQIVVLAWLLSREQHIPGDHIGNLFNSKLYILMFLANTLSLVFFESNDNDVLSSDIALSGFIARQFVIRAIPLCDGNRGCYELNRIAFDIKDEEQGSYIRLARVMNALAINKLIIAPTPPSVENTSLVIRNASEPPVSSISVYGVAGTDKELLFYAVFSLNNDEEETLPLLLNSLVSKQLPKTGVRCLLAPNIIGEIANWIGMNEISIKLSREAGVAFSVAVHSIKLSAEVEIDRSHEGESHFNLPDDTGLFMTTLVWRHETNDFSLVTKYEDERDFIHGQYQSPAWLNKMLAVELSYLGYRFVHKWVESGFTALLPADKAVPTYEVRYLNSDQADEDSKCLVCLTGFNDLSVPLQKLPCNHLICTSCLSQLLKGVMSSGSQVSPRSFDMPCPMCREPSNYMISP